ncbi:MAG: ABC transporter substrate-binding protein [Bacteroidetes bacterium]|nr:ABC transporter substrate-binding protein [Bacteroidota bacterium]
MLYRPRIIRQISLFAGIVIGFLIVSCSGGGSKRSHEPAKGDRVYGGTFTISETDDYQTLYPIALADAVSSFLANQIYEGLVKFSVNDLSVNPGIAEKWEIDPAGTTYTFHLKKGVFFQDDECFPEGKGREVKASDVKYSFELLCSQSPDNVNFASSFKNNVKGAIEYYEASAKGKPASGLEGVKVIDDYTVQIILQVPSTSFLYILASPIASIVPKEGVEKYGNELHTGTGPFMFGVNDKKAGNVVLLRNPNYHRVDSFGNQLPFVDSLVMKILGTKSAQLEAFEKGEVDVVLGLPSESVRSLVEKQIEQFKNKTVGYILERTPEMASNYYEFNLTRPPFDDVRVRKAFSYAINRNKIIDDILKGEAYGPGIYGVSPPSFKEYDITKIKGYDYNPDMANRLFYESGYKDKKTFPVVKVVLNSGGAKNTKVALEIQKQLMDVLGIRVDFEVKTLAQKLEDAKYARADILRAGWLADYPNPESFLWMFYGAPVPESLDKPSFPNTTRYKNPEFDKLFEKGRTAKTRDESYMYFAQAEQVMMNDAPIMMLWYDENYRLIKSRVKRLPANPIRYRDCSEVYLQDTTPAIAGAEKK